MAEFAPQNPEHQAIGRASFARQGLMQTLGIELVELAQGRCVLAAADARLSQQHGYFHGALIGAMLDSAGGYAALSLMPPASDVLTTEYKINFLAAAEGECLIARGRVIEPGRSLTVCQAEAFCRSDAAETPCAVMLQTLFRIPLRPGRLPPAPRPPTAFLLGLRTHRSARWRAT